MSTDTEALNALHQQATAEEAAQPDATAGDQPAPAATVVTMDPAEELFIALQISIGLLSPSLPYLPTIYTEQVLRNIAQGLAKVAEKYGWDTSGFFARYAPELMLAAAILPTVPALTRAHKAWAAERATRAEPVQGDQQGAPDAGQGAAA